MIEILVVGLHLRWRGVWQRPNHIISRLARRVPVLVVEEPLAAPHDRNGIASCGDIRVLVPERSTATDVVDETTLAEVRRVVGGRAAALWLYTPLMLALGEALPHAPLVYDKMDELANFAFADPRIVAREDEVLRRACVVFAGGRSLWESVRARARAGAAFPSGVDLAHYGDVGMPRPSPGRRPVFGYVGVIDERLDLALLAALAAARPDATLTLVGPIAKIDPASLPHAPNISYLGQRAYAELPQLVADFDVALMPFALDATTRSISPTKTLEYLAAGRSVVSTAIPDVVADFADVVHIGYDHASFIAAVAEAQRDDPARRERGRAVAAAHTWDAIFEGMLAELSRNGIEFAHSNG